MESSFVVSPSASGCSIGSVSTFSFVSCSSLETISLNVTTKFEFSTPVTYSIFKLFCSATNSGTATSLFVKFSITFPSVAIASIFTFVPSA